MSTIHTLAHTGLATFLLANLGLQAQTAPTPQGTPAPKAGEAVQPAPTPPRELKTQDFILKNRHPNAIRNILQTTYMSRFGNAFVITEPGLRMISVRDLPENLAVIAEAIQRMDAPTPVGRQVEFTIHVLFASKQEGGAEELPEDVKPVLTALKSTLNYRSYTLAASFLQRSQIGAEELRGNGETPVSTRTSASSITRNSVRFGWGVTALRELPQESGTPLIQFTGFELVGTERIDDKSSDTIARVRTDVTLKDGERVVVGTSVMKDRGLVVVLTARYGK